MHRLILLRGQVEASPTSGNVKNSFTVTDNRDGKF